MYNVASVRLSDIFISCQFSNKHKFHALMFSYCSAKYIKKIPFLPNHIVSPPLPSPTI